MNMKKAPIRARIIATVHLVESGILLHIYDSLLICRLDFSVVDTEIIAFDNEPGNSIYVFTVIGIMKKIECNNIILLI
jgi:hypothetical protein